MDYSVKELKAQKIDMWELIHLNQTNLVVTCLLLLPKGSS